MRDTKKARPGEATPGAGRGENAACDGAAFSTVDCSMGQPKMQTIFDLLPQGEQNAVASKDLAELAGAASVRELQSMIAQEREDGALILSTCRGGGGYFRPSPGDAGKAEIERYISTLRMRALSTLRVLRSAKAAVATPEVAGQIDLEDMGVM